MDRALCVSSQALIFFSARDDPHAIHVLAKVFGKQANCGNLLNTNVTALKLERDYPMGKLTKFATNAVLLKKTLAKPEAFNVGEFAKAIAADAGAMVKVSNLDTFAKLIKSEKWEKPVIHLGVAKGDLVISGQSANGKQDSMVVVKGYEKIKEDRKKVAVINADKGDDTIDRSADRMAKAKGVDVQDAKDAKINTVKGDIIILAHGDSKVSKTGNVYAKKFADKKPADIVKYLAKDKKLPLAYNGIVYLDGCFTAAGPSKGTKQNDLDNFARSVYKGLVKLGYDKLQVKGNLGAATTRRNGKEKVVDAQMEAAFNKAMEPFLSEVAKQEKSAEKAGKSLEAAVKMVKKLEEAKKA